jgi:hypothetical protein
MRLILASYSPGGQIMPTQLVLPFVNSAVSAPTALLSFAVCFLPFMMMLAIILALVFVRWDGAPDCIAPPSFIETK